MKKKKRVHEKNGNLTFFSLNWFANLSEYIWIFSDFFLSIEFFFFFW